MKIKHFIFSTISFSLLFLGAQFLPNNIQITDPITASADTYETFNEPVSGTSGDFAYFGTRKMMRVTMTNGGSYTYYTGESEVKISEYTGNSAYVTVPSYVDGYRVVTLYDWAFYDNQTVQEVTVSEGIERLYGHTFAECRNLRTVRLPSTMQRMGYYCEFRNCTALTDIYMPNDIFFPYDSFNGCISLERINGMSPFTLDSAGRPVWNTQVQALAMKLAGADGVKFVDQYMDAWLAFVVNTQLRGWMSDFVKARVLHDYLIDNIPVSAAQYYTAYDLYKGFLIEGCVQPQAIAYIYALLLKQAGIESFICYSNSLNATWNVVMVNNTPYYADVYYDKLWDDQGRGRYNYFMISGSDLIFTPFGSGVSYDHFCIDSAYAEFTTDLTDTLGRYYGLSAPDPSLYPAESMFDNNKDGLLDLDFDFDGINTFADPYNAAYYAAYFNISNEWINAGSLMDTNLMNNLMPNILNAMLRSNLTPDQLVELGGSGHHGYLG